MNTVLVSAIAAVLLLPGVAFGQTETEIDAPTAATSTPSTTWLPNTLFKLGTGLTRESGYGSYSGLLLPITLGVERQLAPKFSVYGNVSSMLRAGGVGHRPNNVPFLQLSAIDTDLGGRYYYNQAKREQRSRAHGPFVGNYVALQFNNDLYSYKDHNFTDEKRHYGYASSGLVALWGMQRRIGQWGLFDGNAGLGVSNTPPNSDYYILGRGPSLILELNARVSLAH